MPGPQYSTGRSRKHSHQHPGRGRGGLWWLLLLCILRLQAKAGRGGRERKGRREGRQIHYSEGRVSQATLTTVVNGRKALPLAITIRGFSTHLTIL